MRMRISSLCERMHTPTNGERTIHIKIHMHLHVDDTLGTCVSLPASLHPSMRSDKRFDSSQMLYGIDVMKFPDRSNLTR